MVSFCHKCGNRIELKESQFCSKCGAKLPITSSEVQPIDKQKVSQKQDISELRRSSLGLFGMKENKDTKEFELRTGIDIFDNCFDSIKTEELNDYKKSAFQTGVFGHIVPMIIILFLIMFFLYIFPVQSYQGRSYSIADITSICNSPLGVITGASNCGMWNFIFLGGWAIGIIFVILGVVMYLKEK